MKTIAIALLTLNMKDINAAVGFGWCEF